ncbi:MAG: hypothetical protein KGI79_01155 [Patescibacteria group bacterium]|nr:hypothetical protein [Patescibacteria group bacterium]MDE2116465.1 hypothetical protein [Patescibacteria group bacterium]
MNKKAYIEWFGWYGVVATITAYFAVSYGFLGASSPSYQILNFTGSVGLVVIAMTKRDSQLVIVNVVWALIAIVALGAIFLKII